MNHNTRKGNRDLQVSKYRPPTDPRDGVRLIKAFLEIKEPEWREKLICWAEELAKASSDCRETDGKGEPQTRVLWIQRSCDPQPRMARVRRQSGADEQPIGQ
jgi:hypothetical protein